MICQKLEGILHLKIGIGNLAHYPKNNWTCPARSYHVNELPNTLWPKVSIIDSAGALGVKVGISDLATGTAILKPTEVAHYSV